jgi:hypothetical protein
MAGGRILLRIEQSILTAVINLKNITDITNIADKYVETQVYWFCGGTLLLARQ